ncbi:hypothetical protein [Mycolicibacterium llatzerense]|uniref:hypothetical protein n=1 Tax=Mycolicibacterium llatzerense TaxID=280871 RepID=UPI0013A6A9A3|nr:hypothetical protein [Mycolicibacterium llatzerense]
MTDEELLADAHRELENVTSGSYFCARCDELIKPGDSIRVHADYPRAVHVGCRRPQADAPPRKVGSASKVRGQREADQCPHCWELHSGECP